MLPKHGLSPGPSELHDLHTVSGVLALDIGNKKEARTQLAESVRVCGTSEFARRTCGVRPPNLMLAERLARDGDRKSVGKYLADCQHVWLGYAKQIALLAEALELGQRSELDWQALAEGINRPAAKLFISVVKAFMVGVDAGLNVDEIRAEAHAAIKGKLKTGNN
jgi:hypothetical protein